MLELRHHFRIKASAERIFKAIGTKEGLNAWWTEDALAEPRLGGIYTFYFAEHSIEWQAKLTEYEVAKVFEWTFIKADADWTGTKVRFDMEEKEGMYYIYFSHRDWKKANDHMYITNYCWALYLRLLKRYVENGEIVPYSERSDY